MPRVSQKTLTYSWYVSVTLAIVTSIFTFVALYVPFLEAIGDEGIDPRLTIIDIGSLTVGEVNFGPILDILDLTYLSALFLFLLPSYFYRKDHLWRKKIDDNLPYLLREISDAQKVGLPLPRAIVEASKRQYGPLTEELQKMAAKISWGIPFSVGLRQMQANIETPLFDRTAVLILEAEKSGGETAQIFDAAYDHVTELLGLRRERLGAMSPYRYIILISFVVFAFVIVILLNTFFIQLAMQAASQSEAGADADTGFGGLPIHLAGLQMLFFHLLVIEGMFSGLIAAKMSTGSYTQGMTSCLTLLTLAWVIFKVGALMV